MQTKNNKVEEIFNDYKTNSNIKYAEVVSLNVLKKTNTLQVALYLDEYIEIKEIWYFENFLKERFKFKNVDIQINYHENVEKKSIKDEWKNIIAYMSHKYPLAKSMLLLKSTLEVVENTIEIELHIKGANFLKAKKADKELQKIIRNLFGKEYNIKITEKLSAQDLNEINKNIKIEEEKAIAHIEEENRQLKEEENINRDFMTQINEEDISEEIKEDTHQEYIIGKHSKAKEKHLEVKNITANDGRITLEGRVSQIEVKQTKSGKGMIIFDLYDGTGTITCKSFAKDYNEGQEIVEKIKTANTIKTIGKARTRHICRRCYCNSKYNNKNK